MSPFRLKVESSICLLVISDCILGDVDVNDGIGVTLYAQDAWMVWVGGMVDGGEQEFMFRYYICGFAGLKFADFAISWLF